MLQKIDVQIIEWVKSIVTDVDVVLGLSVTEASAPTVSLYLLDLAQYNIARVGKRPPLQIQLRYLVSVHAPQPEDAHRLLGELIVAALEKTEKEEPEFEAVFEPLPVEAWAVLGVAPQPSFFLRVPLRHERPEPKLPLVRQPIVVQPSPLRPFIGIVSGPGGLPIMGARVELTTLGLVTRTDEHGWFRFAGVPANTALKLLVQAKGQRQEITLSSPPTASGDEPLELRLHIPEE